MIVPVGVCFFFFQAEDGIRDRDVTGVQTCALPISLRQAAGAQLAPFSCEDALRRDCAGAKTDLVPDALRRFDRDLLADDGARQRDKRLAATRQEYLRPRADDGGHDGVLPRQRSLGAVPVIRLHSAGGSAAGSAAS